MGGIFFSPVRRSLAKRLNKLGSSTKPYETPVLVLISLPFIGMNVLFNSAAIVYLNCVGGFYNMSFLINNLRFT